MPQFGPIRRTELIRHLRQLGFDGPFPGGKHEYMEGRGTRLRISNPHRGDVRRELLSELLRQGRISRDEWESV